MTKQMLEDLVKILQKKIRTLTVFVIILAVLLVGMTVFAFSEFEIGSEETVTYEIEYDSEIEGGGENEIIQVNDMSSDTSRSADIVVICFAAIVCVFIVTVGIVIGVIAYCKSKSKNESKSRKKEKFYDQEEA